MSETTAIVLSCWCGTPAVWFFWCREHALRCRSGAHFHGDCDCIGRSVTDHVADDAGLVHAIRFTHKSMWLEGKTACGVTRRTEVYHQTTPNMDMVQVTDEPVSCLACMEGEKKWS